MRDAHVRRRMCENRRRRMKERRRPVSLSKALRALVAWFRKKPSSP